MIKFLTHACVVSWTVQVLSHSDPVCGRAWKDVAQWKRGLQEVGKPHAISPDLLFHEKVSSFWRTPIKMLDFENDHAYLSAQFKDPSLLGNAHWDLGEYEKFVAVVRDGWLLPSGLVVNRTHRFDWGIVSNFNCAHSGLAFSVGRDNCYKTDWSGQIAPLVPHNNERIQETQNTEFVNDGLSDFAFECVSIPTVISLLDVGWYDYGYFHEWTMPKLLWPEVQKLSDAIVVWPFNASAEDQKGFLKPWIKLLGLSWRKFYVPPFDTRMRSAIKFDTLYLPLVAGLDPYFADGAELVSHIPHMDLKRVRDLVRKGLPPPHPWLTEMRVILLLERQDSLRRALSRKGKYAVREAAETLTRAVGGRLFYIRGKQGAFEVGKRVPEKHDVAWKPLSFKNGLHFFAHAQVIIGVHGSLFNHIVASPVGTHVVEIQTIGTTETGIIHRCAVLGLQYWAHPVEGQHTSKVLNLDTARFGQLLNLVSLNISRADKLRNEL